MVFEIVANGLEGQRLLFISKMYESNDVTNDAT